MNPRDSYVSGHPILIPMIDLVTIGAGGGSIAYIDSAGGFHVGPRSAGADPGPACYGRGGTEPTVTDAQVVLGRLDADKLLGGDLPIDPDLARRTIETKIAGPLGTLPDRCGSRDHQGHQFQHGARDPLQFRGTGRRSAGVLARSVRRGRSAARVALAQAVSAKDIIVPVAPGITAAMGLLETDMQYEHADPW